MLYNYSTIAWRNILNQKVYSIISIGSLAIAATAVLLIMMWVQNEQSFDTYHPDAERIFLVSNQEETGINQSITWEHSPYPLADVLTREFPEVELAARMTRSQHKDISINVNGQFFTQDYTAYVDANWFKLFHYDVLEGDLTAFAIHPFSLILTESKAKKIFGQAQVIGQSVKIDSSQYTIRAIIKDNPSNSSFQYDVILPVASTLNNKRRLEEANNWLYPTHRTFVRLRTSSDPVNTAKKITKLYTINRTKENLAAKLLPLKDLHFENTSKVSAFVHGDRMTVRFFLILGALLLITATVNHVNLSVARISARSKEIGIRNIVGASRIQLFLQIIAESFLISCLALGLSFVLVIVSLPAFNSFVDRDFTFNPFVLPTIEVVIVTWGTLLLLISIYPATLITFINPLNLFRGKAILQVKRSSFRRILTASQFSLTVAMFIGAITVYRQLIFVQSQYKGYDKRQLFTVMIPKEHITISNFEQSKAYYRQLESRLQTLKQQIQRRTSVKQISQISMSSSINNDYTISGGIDWEGRQPDYNPEYIDYSVDENFNDIMKLRFLKGRWFNRNFSLDKENTILNETAVKRFGLTLPVIGKRFRNGTIIGIVKDFHHQNLHKVIAPVIIRINQVNEGSFLLEPHEGQSTTAIEDVLNLFHRQFPKEPILYSFINEEFDQIYRADRKVLYFILLLAGLSIMISCIGLLGMMTFVISQRSKEIGLRKILGASVTSIVMLLSIDFFKIIGLSSIVAVPLALYGTSHWLQSFAYKVTVEWWTIVVAVVLAIIIVIITISFQLKKAALTNPIVTLKSN